jgi:hypothetical protein
MNAASSAATKISLELDDATVSKGSAASRNGKGFRMVA